MFNPIIPIAIVVDPPMEMRNWQAEVRHAYLHRQPHYITHITLVVRGSGKKSQKIPIRLVRKRAYTAYFSIFFPHIPHADSIFAVKSLQLFGKETSHMQICDEARKKLESKDLNRRYLETGSEFLRAHGLPCPKIRPTVQFTDNDSSDNRSEPNIN